MLLKAVIPAEEAPVPPLATAILVPFQVPEVIVPTMLAVPSKRTLPLSTQRANGVVRVTEPAATGALPMYTVAPVSIVTAEASV